MDLLFVFCVCLSYCLAAFWSPAGMELFSWLSGMLCFLVFLSLSHIRYGVLLPALASYLTIASVYDICFSYSFILFTIIVCFCENLLDFTA